MSSVGSSCGSSPLFGRSNELAVLSHALAEAQSGRGRLVALVGEAGIGKTRLANEFIQIASQVARCFTGRAYAAEGRLPYGIWIDAFDAYTISSDSFSPLVSLRGHLMPGDSLAGSRQGGLGSAVADRTTEPVLDRSQLFGRFLDFVGQLANDAPVVVFLDDVHFADMAATELLHFVGRRVGDRRLLLLATLCPEGLTKSFELARCLASLGRQGVLTEIRVGPLSFDDSAAIVRYFVQGGGVPEQILKSLHERTSGNPLLLQSLLENLQSTASDPTTWSSVTPVVPHSVSQLITQRTATFSEDAQQLLPLVAVGGEAATVEILTIASAIGDGRVLAALDELRVSQILREELDGNVVRYRFCHPVVHEAVYRQLSQARRAHLHALIGDVIVSHLPKAVGPSELARHFMAASCIGTQRRALPHLLVAAEHALLVFANHEAAQALEAALELLTAEDSGRGPSEGSAASRRGLWTSRAILRRDQALAVGPSVCRGTRGKCCASPAGWPGAMADGQRRACYRALVICSGEPG